MDNFIQMLMSYNNNWPGKIRPLVQYGTTVTLVTNQFLVEF